MFYEEAVMWKLLTHPNIVPLLGITLSPFQLVSEWIAGGPLQNHIKAHPDADRLELVGVHPIGSIPHLLHHQLSDIAKGLCYLHSCNVIHGDLKGVCNCHKHRLITLLNLASKTSSWTSLVMRASWILASPWSLGPRIP